MGTVHKVKLYYRPCRCPSFVQEDKDVAVVKPAEHFEEAKIAALRFRQLIIGGGSPRVHHDGVHVCAAQINGEMFEEPEA